MTVGIATGTDLGSRGRIVGIATAYGLGGAVVGQWV
jgi:hypothetical protein